VTDLSLELIAAETEGEPDDGGGVMLRMHTSLGDIRCRLHRAEDGDGAAVVWVFGSGGGLGGPAGGVYERLAVRLRSRGVTSLQVDYRRPAHLAHSVLDTLAGMYLLEGGELAVPGRVALVGHSFGGAVVISAGTLHPSVGAVAAMSSQTFGTEAVSTLRDRPLLLIHGEDDEVLPSDCSRDIFRRAADPKDLIVYPGCRHGLDQCRDDLDRDLTAWLERSLGLSSSTPTPAA
jgi:pimeloyl-ACP methyl ester carboxylesterase